MDGDLGLRFRVLALFLCLRGALVSSSLVFWLWGASGLGRGHSTLFRSYSEPRKGKGLGQASRMVGLPGSEIPDPRTVAAYSLSSRPWQKQLCVPEGAPVLTSAPARVLWLQRPGQNSQSPLPPPRVTQAQPPSCGPPCPLWVSLLSLLTSPTSRSVRPRAGSPPRSRWQASSEHTELTLRL